MDTVLLPAIDQIPAPEPFFESNYVSIVMAFNDHYAPYAAVTISSIIKASNSLTNYDIMVFDGGVSDRNKKFLEEIVKPNKNISIRYFDPEPMVKNMSLPTHMYFSRDIYYRLYIPEIFRKFDRIVYIDSDVLIKEDIGKLFKTDLLEKSIGATHDFGMSASIAFKILSLPKTGSLETKDYLESYVGLKDIDAYFQSGVLLFDINKSLKYMDKIKDILSSGKVYWYPDQDILNEVYQGDVFFLDLKWNVFADSGDRKTYLGKLPIDVVLTYFEAKEKPFIVHFAGPKKPWKFSTVDFFEEFWLIARETPWYEQMLFNMVNGNLRDRDLIGIRDIIRPFGNLIAPFGTKRRNFLRSAYNMLSRKVFRYA
jgi:lipopolysaccharide biosynthesis glycosyltransferase